MLKFWNGLKARLRIIIFHWHIELVIRSGKNILTFSQDNNIPCPYLYLYGGDAGGDCVPSFQWTSIISLRLYYLSSDRQEGFVITRAGELLCPNPKRSRNITFTS